MLEAFELDCFPSEVAEEHRGMLAWLSFIADAERSRMGPRDLLRPVEEQRHVWPSPDRRQPLLVAPVRDAECMGQIRAHHRFLLQGGGSERFHLYGVATTGRG